jgi:DNA-binding MarR family transcriptional regulator
MAIDTDTVREQKSIIDMSTMMSDTALIETFGRVRRQINLIITQDLKPLGIGPKQAVILRYLADHGPSSAAEISRTTITDPAATCRTLEAMIRKGWILQQEHPDDRRRYQVSLSRKGAKLVDELRATVRKSSQKIFKPLSEKERTSFHEYLLRIQKGLQ